MNLNHIINPNSKRVERKIILSQGQSIFFKYPLLNNGYKKIFRNRKITSVYFDDISLSALRDNIDGNRSRNKLRLRFYDDNLSDCFLEIKQKRGLMGYKKRIKFNYTNKSLSFILEDIIKWSRSFMEKKMIPTSIVSYNRDYFAKNSFRVTIDTKVTSYRIVNSTKILSSLLNYEVIEFKYAENNDEKFRNEFRKLANFYYRSTKCSKYSNSLMY